MSETQIPVQVTITNDQIDKAIIDSLVGTQLGKEIATEIERCFGSGFGSVNVDRIVNNIVEKQIQAAVEKILVNDHAETIKAFVTNKMTDEFVNAIFEKMWERRIVSIGNSSSIRNTRQITSAIRRREKNMNKSDDVDRSPASHCYMPHPLRVQRKRTKGFRLPSDVICVTRPGPWGNPFRAQSAIEAGYANTESEARALCVECFEDWLLKGDLSEWWLGTNRESWTWMRENLSTLAGRKLACFCPLKHPCHADVLAKLAPMACPF